MSMFKLVSIYSPMQKLKTTSDFSPSWNMIVYSAWNERVEMLSGTLLDSLFLLRTFIKQLSIYACLWRLCANFSYMEWWSKTGKKQFLWKLTG